MVPKKIKSANEGGIKSLKRITIDTKKEIIAKYESGVRVSNLAKEYEMAKSTISTILKKKDALKKADVSKGVTKLTKQRSQVLEEVEKLLLIWINEKRLKGDSISEALICAKALELHQHLLSNQPSRSDTNIMEFKASRGWFEKFRRRTGIHSVLRHGEAASSDHKAAEKYVEDFGKFVDLEGYAPDQVFNCDETGLFWKKMPKRTYITKEEKLLPGHKPMKDRLTLLLCANASGDFKIKPLLVYHSENPRVFKSNKVIKNRLPVMWRSNSRAWVTRIYFREWLNDVFAPSVKTYLEEKNLPLKCVLLMDNAPAHPPNVEEDLDPTYNFIKIKFLPPNTTPLLQPMDQQVISNFKKAYMKALFSRCFQVTNDTDLTLRDFWKNHFNIVHCIDFIDKAWNNVSCRTLQSAWRKLWPASVPDRHFEGFEEEADAVHDIVSIGKSMELEIDENDVIELLQDHNQELTAEELMELQLEQVKAVEEEYLVGEQEVPDASTVEIKDICNKWSEVQAFIEKYHPDKTVTSRAVEILNDNVMEHFRKILQQRKKQLSLDHYFMQLPTASPSKK